MSWWRRLLLRLAGVHPPVIVLGPNAIVVLRARVKMSAAQRELIVDELMRAVLPAQPSATAMVLDDGLELVGVLNPVGRP